jgi:hypothetical protein
MNSRSSSSFSVTSSSSASLFSKLGGLLTPFSHSRTVSSATISTVATSIVTAPEAKKQLNILTFDGSNGNAHSAFSSTLVVDELLGALECAGAAVGRDVSNMTVKGQFDVIVGVDSGV